MRLKPKLKGKLEKALMRRLQKLIQTTLKKKHRSKKTYLGKSTLTKQSGNLFGGLDNIKPEFKMNGGKLNIDVKMMEYYKYLDEGTEHIEPWFFSEEIMDSRELGDIVEELLLITVEETILDIQSNIKK